jgi:MYXO-CTERM domain-containing protein
MRTRALLAMAVLTMGTLLAGSAHALGNQVLINCHHGDGAICLENFDAIDAALTPMGAQIDKRADIPASVADGDFRLIIISTPNAGWDTPTRNLVIPGFLSIGGRIVFLADNEATDQVAYNQLIREMLAYIPDHDLVLSQDILNPNPGCGDAPSTLIQGDPLTAGLTQWHVGQSNRVFGGDPLINFNRDDGLGVETLASVYRANDGGEVILMADMDGVKNGAFMDACATAGTPLNVDHLAFWQNLYDDQSAAPDADGDGYDSDEDCNDQNPSINPGADEECNGLDDNCDGVIDEGCDDDDDTTAGDDDDDDTTAGDDDDDDSTGFGDDDDSFRDDSEWNSCACGSDEEALASGPGGWLFAVLPLGAFLGRRRRS